MSEDKNYDDMTADEILRESERQAQSIAEELALEESTIYVLIFNAWAMVTDGRHGKYHNQWPMAVFTSIDRSPVDDTWQEFTHSEYGLLAWAKGDYTVIAYPVNELIIPVRDENE